MPRIPPPIVSLVFGVLSYALGRLLLLGRFDFSMRTATAVSLAVIGLAIILTSVFVFRRASTTINPIKIEEASALVTSGPFRFSRNPMYLGMLLILTGLAIWLGEISGLIALPLFAAYITAFQIKPEEAMMKEIFGDAFAGYAQKTRRWI